MCVDNILLCHYCGARYPVSTTFCPAIRGRTATRLAHRDFGLENFACTHKKQRFAQFPPGECLRVSCVTKDLEFPSSDSAPQPEVFKEHSDTLCKVQASSDIAILSRKGLSKDLAKEKQQAIEVQRKRPMKIQNAPRQRHFYSTEELLEGLEDPSESFSHSEEKDLQSKHIPSKRKCAYESYDLETLVSSVDEEEVRRNIREADTELKDHSAIVHVASKSSTVVEKQSLELQGQTTQLADYHMQQKRGLIARFARYSSWLGIPG